MKLSIRQTVDLIREVEKLSDAHRDAELKLGKFLTAVNQEISYVDDHDPSRPMGLGYYKEMLNYLKLYLAEKVLKGETE